MRVVCSSSFTNYSVTISSSVSDTEGESLGNRGVLVVQISATLIT